MRQYRGKTLRDGKWTYGWLVMENDGTAWISRYFHRGEWEQIDPETVGQFTGLYDKNGKEIYEGDIVRWLEKYVGVIEWNTRMSGYYFMRNGSGFQFHEQQQINPEHGGLLHVEVIGNCHDNSELLGVKP